MQRGSYRISIEGEWTLEDLYIFPRAVSQVYALMYSLQVIADGEIEIDPDDRTWITYRSQPWRGGYSAVNFYKYLQSAIPRPLRPRIVSIHYASPGWLELSVGIVVARSVGDIVKSFCDAGKEINSLYNSIYKGLQDRKLLRISVKREEFELRKDELEFLEFSASAMARMMGFKNLRELQSISPNPLATLKILLSLYRRVRTLARYEREQKADFRKDQ